MAGNLEPQDRYSASALMQLGGRDLNVATDASANIAGPSMVHMTNANGGVMTQTHAPNAGNMGGTTIGNPGMTWPLNIFDIGQPGNGSQ
jgi:hypothetical protein